MAMSITEVVYIVIIALLSAVIAVLVGYIACKKWGATTQPSQEVPLVQAAVKAASTETAKHQKEIKGREDKAKPPVRKSSREFLRGKKKAAECPVKTPPVALSPPAAPLAAPPAAPSPSLAASVRQLFTLQKKPAPVPLEQPPGQLPVSPISPAVPIVKGKAAAKGAPLPLSPARETPWALAPPAKATAVAPPDGKAVQRVVVTRKAIPGKKVLFKPAFPLPPPPAKGILKNAAPSPPMWRQPTRAPSAVRTGLQ